MTAPRFFAAILLCAVLSSGAAAEPPTVRFACNEFPPQKMAASPDGLPGFDVEFLRESFARAGARISIDFLPWQRALEYVRDGHYDALCSCSRHPDRDSWLVYSDEMGRVGVGVFEKASSDGARTDGFATLAGKTVGVVRAYNLHQELISAGIGPIAVSDDSKGMQMLMNDRIDAFFTFGETGRYILSKMPEGESVVYSEFRASPYFACFGRTYAGAEAARQAFNAGLASIRADGTYGRILSKYR